MREGAGPFELKRLGRGLPLLLFVLALGIRLLGIGWGLKNDLHNASYHPDEPIIFGYSRSIVPGQGQFVPHFYNYGTLYLTLLRVTSDVTTTYTGAPQVKGDGWSYSNPDAVDWAWVSRCHLAGRILTAFAGAGTVVVLFFLGRRCFGALGGTAAAVALMIAPGHVMHSRFQTVDVVSVFLLALSTWYALRLLPVPDDESPDRGMRWAVLAGLFAGLSASTKYTGILALLSLLVALALSRRRHWIVELAAGLFTAAVAFVLTTPGVILEWPVFVANVTFEMRHTSGGQLAFAGTNGFSYQLANLSLTFGPLLAFMGAAGLVWAGARRHAWALVVLAFAVPYYVLIGRAHVGFLRYSLPIDVGVAVGFGYAMAVAARKGSWGRAMAFVGVLAVIGLPTGGLRHTFAITRSMVEEDPRDVAALYLRTTNPSPVGFVSNPWFWSPPLYLDSAEPRSMWLAGGWYRALNRSTPPLVLALNPSDPVPNRNVGLFDSSLLTDLRPPRISLSSFEYGYLLRLRGRKNLEPEFQGQIDQGNEFLDRMRERYSLERSFGGPATGVEDFDYVNPEVQVWKRREP